MRAFVRTVEQKFVQITVNAQEKEARLEIQDASGTQVTFLNRDFVLSTGKFEQSYHLKVEPRDWEERVAGRKLALNEFKGVSYEDLLIATLEKFFEDLERDSLLEKIDLLFGICQPPAGWSPMTDYRFDRDRVQAFDGIRHDIIHGSGPRAIPGVDDELYYLQRTTVFLIGLVNHRYRLLIDPAYLAHRSARKPP